MTRKKLPRVYMAWVCDLCGMEGGDHDAECFMKAVSAFLAKLEKFNE